MVMMAIPTARSRIAAVAMFAIGMIGLVRLPLLVEVASYLAVLAAFIAAVALYTSFRLWFVGHIAARLLAVTVAGLVILGQVLNMVAGLPGAGELGGSAGVWDVAGFILAVLTLVVLSTDRDRSPPGEPAPPPYAL